MGEKILLRYYDSPLGRLKLGAFGGRLCLCCWCDNVFSPDVERLVAHRLEAEFLMHGSPATDRAAAALDDFFGGRGEIRGIPLLLPGTDFQRRVWFSLSFIHRGETVSYAGLCRRVTGGVSAVRAVASAVGDNPVCIFLPCHRVVGSNGSLTGYAGGLGVKAALLELEGGDAAF